MPFTIDQLSEIHAILVTPADSGMVQEMQAMESALLPLFDALTEPVFLIFDLRAVKLGLDAITQSANETRRDRPQMIDHPNQRELLVITQDRLITLAIQGMSSPIFGSMKIRVFVSPEQALDYCRSQIAEEADQGAEKKSG